MATRQMQVLDSHGNIVPSRRAEIRKEKQIQEYETVRDIRTEAGVSPDLVQWSHSLRKNINGDQLLAERKMLFLLGYVEFGTIIAACKTAAVAQSVVATWCAEDPEFAQHCINAEDAVTDMIEDIALRRAYEGSDAMIMFLLRGRRPEKYGEAGSGLLDEPATTQPVMLLPEDTDLHDWAQRHGEIQLEPEDE